MKMGVIKLEDSGTKVRHAKPPCRKMPDGGFVFQLHPIIKQGIPQFPPIVTATTSPSPFSLRICFGAASSVRPL
jgi:hypothetical protein